MTKISKSSDGRLTMAILVPSGEIAGLVTPFARVSGWAPS